MRGDRINENDILPLLACFYERVRNDAQLGPVFQSVVDDWAVHLARLEDFWSAVMLTSGRYKGNPVAIHVQHANQIGPEMFTVWLGLWRQTTNEMVSPALASEMQFKAGRIAERLAFAMHGPSAIASLNRDHRAVLLPIHN